jgi:hypothetical protein
MSATRVMERLLERVLMVAGGLTIIHALFWIVRHEPRIQYADEAARIGEAIAAEVADWGGGAPLALSDVDDGYCRYVVVASGTCPFSKQAAVRWTVSSLQEGAQPLVPSGWRTHWVLFDADAVAAEFRDPWFPAPMKRPVDARLFVNQAGITGSPYYLLLDRTGRIIERGPGAVLPELDAFRSDCRIDDLTSDGPVDQTPVRQ